MFRHELKEMQKTKFVQYWFVAENEYELGCVLHVEMQFSFLIVFWLSMTLVFEQSDKIWHEKQPTNKLGSLILYTNIKFCLHFLRYYYNIKLPGAALEHFTIKDIIIEITYFLIIF